MITAAVNDHNSEQKVVGSVTILSFSGLFFILAGLVVVVILFELIKTCKFIASRFSVQKILNMLVFDFIVDLHQQKAQDECDNIESDSEANISDQDLKNGIERQNPRKSSILG